ncbi:energy transducer TonB [Helicobacter suis]|uniref:energy transducer TonB n=1 Tax=Helicobacter suis TaxID=104628 RepID=UPI0013D38EBE|nr:energy transducer TonB [Helicobacter suis]
MSRSARALDRDFIDRRSDRNFYVSLFISCLLHLFLWWLVQYSHQFFHQPKLVKLNPSNLLVLKRGRSLDPSKHTQGALRPSRAAPKHNQTPPTPQTPPRPPSPPSPPVAQPKPQPRPKPKRVVERKRHTTSPHKSTRVATRESHHKALRREQREEPKKTTQQKADDFNPNSLSFLPSEQNSATPPPTPSERSYESDKGMDSQTRKDIDELYGEEFGDLGTAEKDFIKSNLSEIGRITQKYLEYPSAAGYLGQDGVDAVEFYLHPNGDITGLKIIEPSGYKLLDDNTLKTITIAYKDYPRPSTTTLIRIRVRYFIYR